MQRSEEFGRYRLERLIGSGGMGDVYEAFDSERDRVVALKLLPELFSANAEFTQRFRRESRIAARLRDPHIIPIHDYGEIDDRLYIDMRLVDNGATIAHLLRQEGPLDPQRAVGLLGQVADALDAAHDDGLVHRDIKPSNVLVTVRDFVYVVDFGIAHVMGQTAHGLTGTYSTVGTLDYMAPERFEERGAERGADIYALACLLYECLTGRTPFPATTGPGLMYAHLHLDPPTASATSPTVPHQLDDVIRVGMAKDPDDRYPSAGALAAAARRAVDAADDAVPARDPGAPAPFRPAGPTVAPARTAIDPTPGDSRGDPPSQGPDDGAGEGADGRAGGAAGTEVSSAGAAADDSTRGGAAATAATVAGPPPAAPASPGEDRPAGRDRDGRRTRWWLLAGVVVAVGVVLGVVTALLATPTSVETQSGPPAAAAAVAASVAVPRQIGTIATPPEPGFVAVDPTGRFGYVTNRAPRTLSVLDLANGRTVAEIPMPSTPRFVAVSADGSRGFVSCYESDYSNSKVAFVDLRTNTPDGQVDVDLQPWALALAPDQRTLWVPSHSTGRIDVVDTVTATVVKRVPVAPNPHWVTFAGDRAYVVNHESNLVTVMDTATATPGPTIPVGRSPHAAALSPDGSRLAVANFEGNDVAMIDTATDQVVARIPVGAGPQHVMWAPDGRHLYTADVNSGTVSVVETTTNRTTSTIPVGPSPTSVALSERGATALVTLLDGDELAVLGTAVR